VPDFNEAWDAAVANSHGEALEGSPVSDGQASGEGTGSETAPSYFDIDSVGDQVVKVKVDGEEFDVPLNELRNGYMRQAAFTQRTQQLAQERERLQAAETLATAYENDPVGVVTFLAQQHGLTFAQAQAAVDAATGQDEGWAPDPRMSAMEQQLQQIQQWQGQQALQQDITRLQNLYGTDFDAVGVINRAMQLRTRDLEGVHLRMLGERSYARQRAEAEAQRRTAAEEEQRTGAKQQLASTVAPSTSAAGAGKTGSGPITSIEAAFSAAKEELGWTWN
jgi:hypothetical protein